MARPQQLRLQIAAVAARLMAQDGIDDFALAKRKAARQLGLTDTRALPANEEIEAQLRAYQDLYQPHEQRDRVREMRSMAVAIMREIGAFHPYLTGRVLNGLAGRYSDIDLQVFTDDAKSLELLLLGRGLDYSISDQRRTIGGVARVIPLLVVDWQGITVNIAVFGARDERTAMKATSTGRVLERAALPAVEDLLARND